MNDVQMKLTLNASAIRMALKDYLHDKYDLDITMSSINFETGKDGPVATIEYSEEIKIDPRKYDMGLGK